MGRLTNIHINILCKLYIDMDRLLWYNKPIMEEVPKYFGAPLGGEIYASIKSAAESGSQIHKRKL